LVSVKLEIVFFINFNIFIEFFKVTPRHDGRIIKLEYNPDEGPIDQTLFLVGKGITYDTGGADVKVAGIMAGNHRDKCGAAFVAGFFKTLSLLKPRGLKVYGTLCVARNNIGEECHVADEIITSRANKRVRVVNTDCEGANLKSSFFLSEFSFKFNSMQRPNGHV
jgi:leucyl aminopeptidase